MDASILLSIPLYQQINLALVGVSVFLVLSCCFVGAWNRGLLSNNLQCDDAPTFPLAVDYLYTILIIGLIAGLNIIGIFSAEPEPEQAQPLCTWLNPIIFLAVHVPIFLRLYQTRHLVARAPINIGTAIGYLILAFALTFFCNGLVQATPLLDWFTTVCGSPETQESLTVFEQYHWQDLLPHITLACVAAPIAEECLFRGMLYPCIKKFVSPALAAVLCGIIFGAIHIALPQMLALTVLGTLLCFIYERGKSLWLPILIHAVFNSFSVIIAINYEGIKAYLEDLEKLSSNL